MPVFASGNGGRVATEASSSGDYTAVATVKSWRLSKSVAAVPLATDESPTLALPSGGVVYPRVLRGVASATVTVEGWFDCDPAAATDATFEPGEYVTLQLLFDRAAPFGYTGVAALCTRLDPGIGVENQPGSFTAEFAVDGVAPRSGTVT